MAHFCVITFDLLLVVNLPMQTHKRTRRRDIYSDRDETQQPTSYAILTYQSNTQHNNIRELYIRVYISRSLLCICSTRVYCFVPKLQLPTRRNKSVCSCYWFKTTRAIISYILFYLRLTCHKTKQGQNKRKYTYLIQFNILFGCFAFVLTTRSTLDDMAMASCLI
jgi:hypothetical protein